MKYTQRISLALAAGLLGVAGGLGWYGKTTLPCRKIDVNGARHAERHDLLYLARVDTGMVLFALEPEQIEARLERHSWVKNAEATRLPTGTLVLDIEERTPVALALDRAGRPTVYLDRSGHAMPLVPDAVYDVPLLRGLKRPEAGKPVDHPTALALLDALGGIDPAADALISDVEIKPSGEAWVYTVPSGPNPTIPVRLGKGRFGPRLDKLARFWHQAVLTRPDQRFSLVDLRFDSQVVTREEVVSRQQPGGDGSTTQREEG